MGHLSKLVQSEDLSDTFGAIGDVVSIDLVPPRGCAFIVMNRRRDASKAIAKLNKHKMHSKAITVSLLILLPNHHSISQNSSLTHVCANCEGGVLGVV